MPSKKSPYPYPNGVLRKRYKRPSGVDRFEADSAQFDAVLQALALHFKLDRTHPKFWEILAVLLITHHFPSMHLENRGRPKKAPDVVLAEHRRVLAAFRSVVLKHPDAKGGTLDKLLKAAIGAPTNGAARTRVYRAMSALKLPSNWLELAATSRTSFRT